ncbi:MAG: hypothetical protein N2385_01920 [Chloroflexus sp.]|nr:hypothetical protein [Chloroflexus sp.]
MKRIQKVLFGLSGILLLLASINSPVLLPYPVFVFVVLRGWCLPKLISPAIRFLFSTSICTLFLEISAWFDNFIRNAPEPALLHPQLIPDLIISIGVYSAWWLAWWLMLQYYHFTTSEIFVITGLYGVIIEQQGAILLAGLSTFPLGAILWVFVATVYGSTMALAFFLVRDSFTVTHNGWVKYPLALGGLVGFTLVTAIAWGIILQTLDIIPPPKLPMWDYPLW